MTMKRLGGVIAFNALVRELVCEELGTSVTVKTENNGEFGTRSHYRFKWVSGQVERWIDFMLILGNGLYVTKRISKDVTEYDPERKEMRVNHYYSHDDQILDVWDVLWNEDRVRKLITNTIQEVKEWNHFSIRTFHPGEEVVE